jgi:hypothetical protein
MKTEEILFTNQNGYTISWRGTQYPIAETTVEFLWSVDLGLPMSRSTILSTCGSPEETSW